MAKAEESLVFSFKFLVGIEIAAVASLLRNAPELESASSAE